MNPSEPTFALDQAIAHLYATLQVPRRIDGHTWYGEEELAVEKRLKKTKRHEVSAEDISYLFMNNCDSEQSLKYYLPRALELLAIGNRDINAFFVAMKVQNAAPKRWPEPERAALMRVLAAMYNTGDEWLIRHTLAEFNWPDF